MVLYLPSSFQRGLFAPDETRILEVTDSINSLDTAILPRYKGERYDAKPPFFFYILKAFLKIPLPPLFLVILLNSLFSWGTALFLYEFFKKEKTSTLGFFSAVFLISSAMFYGMAVTLRMDTLFLFFIMASICFFWWGVEERKDLYLLFAGILTFLAVFTKGALGIVFPLLVQIGIFIFSQEKGATLRGIFIVAFFSTALIFLWMWLYTLVDEDYYKRMIFRQTIERAFSAQHRSHTEGVLYYVPFLFLFFSPWTFLSIGYLVTFKKFVKTSWEKIFILWFFGGFIILSLIRVKLPIYLLLLSPPLASLTAKFFLEGDEYFKKIAFYITVIFFLVFISAAYLYCRVQHYFVPPYIMYIILLFILCLILAYKKVSYIKFVYFFIVWFVLIECLNLIYLPLVSKMRVEYKVNRNITIN